MEQSVGKTELKKYKFDGKLKLSSWREFGPIEIAY